MTLFLTQQSKWKKLLPFRETMHFVEIFWKVLQPGFWAKCWLKWAKLASKALTSSNKLKALSFRDFHLIKEIDDYNCSMTIILKATGSFVKVLI